MFVYDYIHLRRKDHAEARERPNFSVLSDIGQRDHRTVTTKSVLTINAPLQVLHPAPGNGLLYGVVGSVAIIILPLDCAKGLVKNHPLVKRFESRRAPTDYGG